jgi:hypothetical protein
MSEDLEDITKAVITQARQGDMVACRIVLDRIAPARRGAPVQFKPPTTADATGIAEAFGTVIAALANGEMTPTEASEIAGVLELRRRAIETSEVEARLKALESHFEKPGAAP